jgi:hypothetical protein
MMNMQTKYRIRRFVVVAIFLLIIGWALNATTPDECKVSVEEMSNFCKDLLYP